MKTTTTINESYEQINNKQKEPINQNTCLPKLKKSNQNNNQENNIGK